MDIAELKELIFDEGKNQGFTDMEVYYQSNSEFSCKVYKGEIDDYSMSQEGGISFRGIYNGNMGYAYTEKIDESAVEILISIAKENAEIIESDDKEFIFKGSNNYNKVDLYSTDLSTVSQEDKIQFIKELEDTVYKLDDRVKSVNFCTYQDHENERKLYNTKGLNTSEKSNIAIVYLEVIVTDNKEIQNSFSFEIGHNFKELDPKLLAKKAVDKAISYLGAKPIKSKNYTVLLQNMAAADLLQTFTCIFSGENVQKGRSLLKDKLGETIGSLPITIVDDPLMNNGVASRSFDSEGVASERITVIEEGILRSLLHNLKTAQKDGVEPTGHGYKSSYKGTIKVAPSNFYIQPGLNKYDDLVSSMEEGLIITELEGLHSGANPVSGDFSLAAKGYYVKEGKVERPVNQITIASNFYEILQNIESVGNDLAFTTPSGAYIGSPTLKIKDISVAGE